MLHDAVDLESPVLWAPALIMQRLERNADFDLVTPRGHMAERLVDVVGIEVDRGIEASAAVLSSGGRDPAVTPDAVLLHAEWVDGEEERLAVIVVRVEDQIDVIVGVDVIAIGERGAYDRPVRLERANAEVDRVGSVPHEDLGGVARRAAVDRSVV